MDAVVTPTLLDDSQDSGTHFNWLVPFAFLAGAMVCLCVDVQIAFVFREEHAQLPKFIEAPLRDAIEVCEVFGHGVGAALVLIAVAVLAPRVRSQLPWVISGTFGSGLTANTLKTLVYRTRPRAFNFESGTVWTTFYKATEGGMNVQSFPSAHTATAFGLAVMLSNLFPHGRWLFFTLATLVGVQRVVCSAHFPSDVFAGATIGWLVGSLCVRWMTTNTRSTFCDSTTK